MLRAVLPADFTSIAALQEAVGIDIWSPDIQQTWYAEQRLGGCVYEQDGAIVGFALATVHPAGMELVSLAVTASARRQGIGQQLLEVVITAARSARIKQILLHVAVANTTAQKLYQRLGFTTIGQRDNFYTNVADGRALVMALNIG